MPSTASIPQILTLETLAIRFGPIELQRNLTKDEFLSLTERYPDLPMEREQDGVTIIMSPVKRGSGRREFKLGLRVGLWDEQQPIPGEVHGPSSGFDLPDGATKSPDVAWISPERLSAAPAGTDDDQFIQLVPDFVAEVRSHTDRLRNLQHKMTHSWLANGVRLAWLIDPYSEKVWIYRQGQAEPESIEGFAGKSLSGEDVMPGFVFPLEGMRVK
jgi:Uma2 family endonuclease